MLTKEELQAIATREATATSGPWAVTESVLKVYVESENGDLSFSLQYLHPEDGREWAAKATADFIAASRSDVLALLEHISVLERDLEKAEDTWQLVKEFVSTLPQTPAVQKLLEL